MSSFFLGTPQKSTLPETNISHLKIGLPNGKVVFQPSIFRGYVSFRECNINTKNCHFLPFPRPILGPWNRRSFSGAGTYYLSFILASYDASGGGALGAQMGVRNIRSISSCLDEETLANGPVETNYHNFSYFNFQYFNYHNFSYSYLIQQYDIPHYHFIDNKHSFFIQYWHKHDYLLENPGCSCARITTT